MKTIGKIAALAMTLSLAFVLTACGGSSSSSAAASSASASASASASSAAASSAAASASASSAASSAVPADADTYTNEAFGIKYNLPDGWKFVDASTLKDMNSVVSSVTGSESMDMIAAASDGSAAVMVGVVEPSSATSGKTAEQFLQSQTEEMTKALEGSNFAYTSNSAEVTFNGLTRTLPANITSITVEGNTIVIGQAVAEKDGYFLDVVVTGASEDAVLKAFESFAAITK